MLNIPNKITIIRIFLIPFFIAVMLMEKKHPSYFSAFIFAMLALSDFIDGHLARKKGDITDMGKLLDPIADKALVLSALFMLVGSGLPLWAAGVIGFREVLLTVIRVKISKNTVVPANIFGKSKTVLQIIAILFFMLKLPFAMTLIYAAVIATVISGIDYLIKIRKLTQNEIINIPNAITLLRFMLIAPFIYYLHTGNRTISLILFAIITAGDKLDGLSARMTRQITDFGSGFDSFTDWTLIISTFSLLVMGGQISYMWAVLIIIPAIGNGFVKMMYAKREKQVPITLIAKIAVGFTYLTIFSILIGFEYWDILMILMVIGLYISMAVYFVKFMIKS
ncbi:CDP-diacylglycerol--glycerol-3-phosphate 3-phosphatidyltransferase [Candidatus Woesearchaeota archaeon]|nr:CDP-diacylglycerol--glycerol-3-phosphate 3-phosphatidyltransferase [Candidatus Woesearchaeota archaeon]MBI2130603.1 CDP-diacylglycerol--glycerol-3-phosphate 3-phosphatidyltransferase [Candidatus Woesearchaeota archaeon]